MPVAPADALPFGAADFAASGRYFDAAARHPLSIAAAARVAAYADFLRRIDDGQDLVAKQATICALFATLVGAQADEIALVSGTTAGERMVLDALGIARGAGHVVTDALHFDGSLRFYRALAAQGTRVTILRGVDGAVSLDRYDEALRGGASLVTVSATSHINGYRPDLAALTALAHRHGVPVCVDLIQHAGNAAVDLRGWGVDFACCGTYKWLMGDMGLGFLYVRADRPERRDGALSVVPFGGEPAGTLSASAVEALLVSLPRLIATDVAARETRNRPLLARIDGYMAALGAAPLTPAGCAAPIRAFASSRLAAAAAALRREGVGLSVRGDAVRWSLSFYNGADDIDAVADRLARA